jgi:hypothetical protein
VGQPRLQLLIRRLTNSLGSSDLWGDSYPYPSGGHWVTKAADVPTSESTAYPPGGWWDTTGGGAPWNQELSPDSPAGEFVGRLVYEFSGTSTRSDTCRFKNSRSTPLTAITAPGYGWNVTNTNAPKWSWGADCVGWTLAAVSALLGPFRPERSDRCQLRGSQEPKRTGLAGRTEQIRAVGPEEDKNASRTLVPKGPPMTFAYSVLTTSPRCSLSVHRMLEEEYEVMGGPSFNALRRNDRIFVVPRHKGRKGQRHRRLDPGNQYLSPSKITKWGRTADRNLRSRRARVRLSN